MFITAAAVQRGKLFASVNMIKQNHYQNIAHYARVSIQPTLFILVMSLYASQLVFSQDWKLQAIPSNSNCYMAFTIIIDVEMLMILDMLN